MPKSAPRSSTSPITSQTDMAQAPTDLSKLTHRSAACCVPDCLPTSGALAKLLSIPSLDWDVYAGGLLYISLWVLKDGVFG